MLSVKVAEASLACAQEKTAAAAAASVTNTTISHCLGEWKKKRCGYWFCLCQLLSTKVSKKESAQLFANSARDCTRWHGLVGTDVGPTVPDGRDS